MYWLCPGSFTDGGEPWPTDFTTLFYVFLCQIGCSGYIRPFSYLRFSHLRLHGLDFERKHLKILVNTSRDHLLI